MGFTQNNICRSIFCAFIALSVVLFSQKAYSLSERKAEKLYNLLGADHILIQAEQEDLVKLVVGIRSKDIVFLHDIASKISFKVDKDMHKLKRVLNNLEKLISIRYSKGVARAKEGDIDPGLNAFDLYEKAYQEKFIEMFDCKRCDKAEHYKHIIVNNSKFLVDTDDFVSIPNLWDVLREINKAPYKRWKKKYNSLQKKLKKGKRDYSMYYETISFEETRFVKTFHVLQSLLKQITEREVREFEFLRGMSNE